MCINLLKAWDCERISPKKFETRIKGKLDGYKNV